MKITDIRATTVTVPLEAPLRHANGCHWGRFVRTIVEVETDTGLIGLGEMGGGGESAEAGVHGDEVVSRRPRPGAARGDALPAREPDRVALQQPHADPRRARVRLPRHPRPGVGRAGLRHPRRRVRDRVPFASYLFFRYAAADGKGTVRTVDQLVAQRAGAEGEVRLHVAQAEGRRVPAGLRARVLPRAWPRRCPAIASASIPTRSGRPSRRSASAARSRI